MPARFSQTAVVMAGALLIAAVPLTELVAGEFFLLTPIALLLLLVAVPWLRSTVPGGGGRAGALGATSLVGGAVVLGTLLLLEEAPGSAGLPAGFAWIASGAAAACALGWLVLAAAAIRSYGQPRWAWSTLLIAPVIGIPAEGFAQIQVLDLIGVTCIAASGAALIALALTSNSRRIVKDDAVAR